VEPTPTAQTAVATRPDAGKYVIAAGIIMLAFFASYGFAQANLGTAQGAEEYAAFGTAPGGTGGEAGSCACCAPSDAEPVRGETVVQGDVQTISVDASSGYDPNTIVAQAGIPIEIAFSEAYGCMEEVWFPDFGILEDLTSGGAVVTLPALDAGDYSFSCGMQMFFGTIEVR
jgi:hypothetical protein